MSRKPRRAATAREPLVSAQAEFEDNALLPALFGEHDQNLARIEQRLGASLAPRGNRIAISGTSWQVRAAKLVLDGLYGRLRRGREVDQGAVEAAIRMALGGGASASTIAGDWAAELVIQTQKRAIEPRSLMQAAYLRVLAERDLVFALGPAGTGKTYLAVAMAVSMLTAGRVDRIVLSRPAVEAGERLGFLPGDLREKVDPYLRPLYDALHDMMPGDRVRHRLENDDIEIAPLAFMRGRTLSNAFVILDEAQNTSPVQMKMFLTRLGENSRMVVTGDLSQIDLPPGTPSGLRDALDTLVGVEGVETITFTDADVVRHGLVTRIVRAYDARARRESGEAPEAGTPAPQRGKPRTRTIRGRKTQDRKGAARESREPTT